MPAFDNNKYSINKLENEEEEKYKFIEAELQKLLLTFFIIFIETCLGISNLKSRQIILFNSYDLF